jgi:hypothetical protein
MSKIRYNKSKTYLLPLLSEIVGFNKKFFTHLNNVFMFDDLDIYKECLLIEHDFSFKAPEFTLYEHEFINNELFVDLIDIDHKVLYIFRFPEEYKSEYNHFLNGRYSKFGEDAKELILNFFAEVYHGNVKAVPFLVNLKQILFKDNKLKKQLEKDLGIYLDDTAELTDKVDISRETFPLSEYINDENKNKKITPSSQNPFKSD